MIEIKDNIFHISTDNTSYIFRVTKYGDLEHLHYGARFSDIAFDAFFPRTNSLLVSTLYPEKEECYNIDGINFEYSFSHRGDMRYSACELSDVKGEMFDFVFKAYELNEKVENSNLASSYGYDEKLCIILEDKVRGVIIKLYYFVFSKANVITRNVKLANNTDSTITIKRLMSGQLSFVEENNKIITFDGAWCREMAKNERKVSQGRFVNESLSGMSSCRHNPFIMVSSQNSNNVEGECFGINLIYSGNHEESVELSPFGTLSILNGIAPSSGFNYPLLSNNVFTTPESVYTYSSDGYNGVSQNMHYFVKNHIINKRFKNIAKPFILNTWEAMYFNINYQKIKEIADTAVNLGVDMLVVDDGWFGKRNDDTTSLGDWFCNKEKFSNGLEEISNLIHSKGLKFGLWFEPEMISEKSELFKKHSEWAIKEPKARSIIGRNQLILDLTNQDVINYLIDSLSWSIENYKIDYIKWDCNREFSDIKGNGFFHNYILGLYKILDTITKKYPNLIIENCSSGGNRFDLGMFCYCPIGWVSDNTDTLSRVESQEGASYGYPINLMCNHISATPNHQTGRISSLNTRIDTASIGVMGCQMDIGKLNTEEAFSLAEAISNWKNSLNLLEEGNFYRLTDTFQENYAIWQIMDTDGKSGKLFIYQKRFSTNKLPLKIKLKGLKENELYDIIGISGVTAKGSVLEKFGFLLPQNYQGIKGGNGNLELLDMTSYVYKIKIKEV